jgi:hypothetical protein
MLPEGGNYLRIDAIYADTLILHPCPKMGDGLPVIADG